MVQLPKTAIIGLGKWGQIVAQTLSQISEVVAYASNGSLEADAVAKQLFPAARRATVDEIAGIPEVSAVWVATPISTHAAIAEVLISAKKHVLIEKPITQTSEEAATLVALARTQNVTLGTGYLFLFHPHYRAIKHAASKSPIRKLTLDWKKYGTFGVPIDMNLLTHHLALSLDLLGSPESGSYTLTTENAIHTTLTYPSAEVISSINRDSKEKSHSIHAEFADGTEMLWDGPILRRIHGEAVEEEHAAIQPLLVEAQAFLASASGNVTYFPIADDFGLRVLKLHELISR